MELWGRLVVWWVDLLWGGGKWSHPLQGQSAPAVRLHGALVFLDLEGAHTHHIARGLVDTSGSALPTQTDHPTAAGSNLCSCEGQ